MPIYEYECECCRFHFDKRQGFNEPPEAECPRCRGKACRVLHPVPIIFKGSGFYVTDSRKSKGNGSDSEKTPDTAKTPGKEKAGKKPD